MPVQSAKSFTLLVLCALATSACATGSTDHHPTKVHHETAQPAAGEPQEDSCDHVSVLLDAVLTLVPGSENKEFDAGEHSVSWQGRIMSVNGREAALDLVDADRMEAVAAIEEWSHPVLSIATGPELMCDQKVAEALAELAPDELALTITGNEPQDEMLGRCLAGLEQDQLHIKLDAAGDATLEALGTVPGIVELDLRKTAITDWGLAHISAHEGMRTLNLHYTMVSDKGIVHLAGLTGLRRLDLWLTSITDTGMKALAGLVDLRVLNLGMTNITDEGLMHVAGLVELRVLEIPMTGVTDEGLVHLSGLTRLEVLDLALTDITDAGLEHLANLEDLEHLDLMLTGVTDVGLAHISGLKKLEGLVISQTDVTEDGMASLLRVLPQVVINPIH